MDSPFRSISTCTGGDPHARLGKKRADLDRTSEPEIGGLEDLNRSGAPPPEPFPRTPHPGPRMESSLSELVKKTEGLQPWRRVFHAGSGTILVLVLHNFPIPAPTVLGAFGTLLLALATLDGLRLAFPHLNRRFFSVLSLLASPREAGKIASSTWYVLGILLTLALFPRNVALGGILVLALADPTASYLGRRWGKRKLGGGTVEGSVVFTVVASGTLSLFAPWAPALGAALVTAAIEALPWPVDDNLSVPLTAAGALFLLL